MTKTLPALLLATGPGEAGPPAPPATEVGMGEILPIDQVSPGLAGSCRTVFTGSEIEEFGFRVLGILKDAIGPGHDLILVRLTGKRAEYTGVVAGMSGSPCYHQGKLLGAISYRFGIFVKEPIAGITPAEDMLPVMDGLEMGHGDTVTRRRGDTFPSLPSSSSPRLTISPSPQDPVPIETPLVCAGFAPGVLDRYRERLRGFGLLAFAGGSGSEDNEGGGPADAGEEPWDPRPGGAVAGLLIGGDMTMAGTGTITMRRGDSLTAFGHPFLHLGEISMPMARARIITTLVSEFWSYKISEVGEVTGGIFQDRVTAVAGLIGDAPPTIPLRVQMQMDPHEMQQFEIDLFRSEDWSPFVFIMALANTLYNNLRYTAGGTVHLRGEIHLREALTVSLNQLYSAETMAPLPFLIAFNTGGELARLLHNQFTRDAVESISLNFTLSDERREVEVAEAWTERSVVHPGEELKVYARLRSYRNQDQLRSLSVTLPQRTPEGRLEILIGGARELDLFEESLGGWPQPKSLGELVRVINRRRLNDHLHLLVLLSLPVRRVGETLLPALPPTIYGLWGSSGGRFPRGAGLGAPYLKSQVEVAQVVQGSRRLKVRVERRGKGTKGESDKGIMR